jgi:hypothetical protein
MKNRNSEDLDGFGEQEKMKTREIFASEREPLEISQCPLANETGQLAAFSICSYVTPTFGCVTPHHREKTLVATGPLLDHYFFVSSLTRQGVTKSCACDRGSSLIIFGG